MLDSTIGQLRTWWAGHGGTVILVALTAALVLALISALVMWKRGRGLAVLTGASYVSVMVLSAQGTWHLLYDLLHVGVVISVIACAIFELALVSQASKATTMYRRTTVWVSAGTDDRSVARGCPRCRHAEEPGAEKCSECGLKRPAKGWPPLAVAHGCPRCRREEKAGAEECSECGLARPTRGWPLLAGWAGTHGSAVWLIATAAGVIIALSGHSTYERVLRLVLPMITAGQWWADLVADGRGRSYDGGQFRLTPRRVAIKLRLITPDDSDLETESTRDLARRMAKLARKIHNSDNQSGRITRWRKARLERMTLAADGNEELLEEVRRQVALAADAMKLTDPKREPQKAPAPAGEEHQEKLAEAGQTLPAPPRAPEPPTQRVAVEQWPTLPANGGHTGPVMPARTNGHVPAGLSADLPAAGPVRMSTTVQPPADTSNGQTDRTEPARRADPERAAGQHRAADSGPADRTAPARPSRTRVDDDAVLDEHRETLLAAHRDGKLTRYRVQQVTGLGARPADRIAERVREEAERAAAAAAPAELSPIR